MERLSTEHREALIAISIKGFSYEEAAEVLKIKRGTVRSRVPVHVTNCNSCYPNPTHLLISGQEEFLSVSGRSRSIQACLVLRF